MSNRYSLQVYNRDFSLREPISNNPIIPLSWGKTIYGGCDFAKLTIYNPEDFLVYKIANNIRAPIEIYDARLGKAVWWGFIEEVTGTLKNNAEIAVGATMEAVANKVRVVYSAPSSSVSGSTQAFTSWVEDSVSQNELGIKELTIGASELSSGTALALANTHLAANKYPRMVTNFGAQNSIDIIAKGWIHSLDWRYLENDDGIESHLVGQNTQSVGELSATQRIMQIFSIASAWDAGSIALNLQKTGSPPNLLAEIHTLDGSGNPLTKLATATFTNSNITDTMTWHWANLDSVITLSTGTYGLVIRYTTDQTDTTNHYLLGVDPELGYTGGGAKTYNGSTWAVSTDFDVAFEVIGLQETTEQISTAVNTFGQYISSVSIIDASGISTNQFRDGTTTVLTEIKKLVDIGTSNDLRFSLEVSPTRQLIIRELPGYTEDQTYLLDLKGNLYDPNGIPVDGSENPVGIWAGLRENSVSAGQFRWLLDSARFMVERSEFDATTGRWKPYQLDSLDAVQILGGVIRRA